MVPFECGAVYLTGHLVYHLSLGFLCLCIFARLFCLTVLLWVNIGARLAE